MIEDRVYCMSSFLQFRTIADNSKCFTNTILPNLYDVNKIDRKLVRDSFQLESLIADYMKKWTQDGKAALCLSGGIDSAILAKYMPEESTAYTFRCRVPGKEVIDESSSAAEYCKLHKLNHKIVDIYWEDFECYSPVLMQHKGMPMHSIEVQIYKAALQAKKEGFTKLIFGETADINYGGMDKLLSKDWTIGEFINRYSYVMPYTSLKKYEVITEPFTYFVTDSGYEDVHEFLRTFTLTSSMGSYENACQCAGIEMLSPYLLTKMAVPLDYIRVRNGENKYFIREIFSRLYPNFVIPEKLPMPRPMNEWLKTWKGPTREEFWPNCTINMDGDQKWLIWILEKFLNLIDGVN